MTPEGTEAKATVDPPGGAGVRRAIISQFQAVAASRGKRLQTLNDELDLSDSGLDSLCFAIIVAELEDRLGVDPFSSAEDPYFPVTFGDFVRFYESAANET